MLKKKYFLMGAIVRKNLRITIIKLFVFISPFLQKWKRYSSDVENKSLVIVRHGGIGDLLIISSLVVKIKKINPKIKISLMTQSKYHSIFNRLKYFDKFYDYNLFGIIKLIMVDSILLFDNIIESDIEAKNINLYDLLSEKYSGILLDDIEKRPYVSIEENSNSYLLRSIPLLSKKIKKIGIQLFSGSPIRTPSTDFWINILGLLIKNDPHCCIVFICDKKNVEEANVLAAILSGAHSRIEIVNFGVYSRCVDDLISLVGLLDFIICPDSSVAHIAAAFEIPTISVYGPFPSELRTKYYVANDSIDAPTFCAPCFTHGHKPCCNSLGGVSPCFDDIEIYKLEVLITEKYKDIQAISYISEIIRDVENNSCYIIGKGPSLDQFNFKRLDKNITICINDSYEIVEKVDYIFYHDAVFLPNIQRDCADKAQWILPHQLNCSDGSKILCNKYIDIDLYENIYMYNKYHVEDFSSIDRSVKKIDNVLFSKSGTVQSAIHFAYKLGFKKIYLVGIDGGYVSGKIFAKYFEEACAQKTDVRIYTMIRDDAINLMEALCLDYEFVQ